MWGIIPAAGRGSRIQPLAFSKELLPLGKTLRDRALRPCAVAEYLLDRMLAGGADKLCIVIGAGKSDIVEYFGGQFGDAQLAYVVQPSPSGLCDAIFRAAPLLGDDDVTADRNYIKEFSLRRSRELGKQYGVEYAEAFHYIPAGTAGADLDPRIQKYIQDHVIPR